MGQSGMNGRYCKQSFNMDRAIYWQTWGLGSLWKGNNRTPSNKSTGEAQSLPHLDRKCVGPAELESLRLTDAVPGTISLLSLCGLPNVHGRVVYVQPHHLVRKS